jgi:hypothetical protein
MFKRLFLFLIHFFFKLVSLCLVIVLYFKLFWFFVKFANMYVTIFLEKKCFLDVPQILPVSV